MCPAALLYTLTVGLEKVLNRNSPRNNSRPVQNRAQGKQESAQKRKKPTLGVEPLDCECGEYRTATGFGRFQTACARVQGEKDAPQKPRLIPFK